MGVGRPDRRQHRHEGRPEPNLDPADRIAVEQLARVAELQVQGFTGRDFDAPVRVEPLNRTQWAAFLDDERPLLQGLAGSLGNGLAAQLRQAGDDDPDLFAAGEIPGWRRSRPG